MKHNHHNHCWHIVGKSPTTQNEVCCWCGARRIQPSENQISGIHGPHAPKEVVIICPSEFKGEGIA